MKRVDNNMETISMEEFVVPESLFEALDQVDYGYNNTLDNSSYFNTNNMGLESSFNNSMMDFNDFDLSSDTMASFLEMEQVPEVIETKVMEPKVTPVIRPSVIKKSPAMKPVNNLGDILTSCGIEHDLVEDQRSPVASPSSIHSDMELEKNQELIEELEEFFMKTEGKPTVVEETETINTGLSLQELQGAMTTNMVTEDGQNVIIIIAPSSPSETQDIAALSPVNRSEGESDPEWSPYPHSDSPLQSPPAQTKPRKKYARSKPPKAPSGPYPLDKKERKKAQNRTAAFRYREKMKSAMDNVEDEMEALEERNGVLRDQLTEMETEFKYLKKLMSEAGLGRYAAAVKY